MIVNCDDDLGLCGNFDVSITQISEIWYNGWKSKSSQHKYAHMNSINQLLLQENYLM